MNEITVLSKYIDINPRYKIKNSNITETGLEAINSSIENIIGTVPGERVFNPSFGSRVEYLLFEPINDQTAASIFYAISDAIALWETRIDLVFDESYIIPDPEEYEYQIFLVYKLRETESVGTLDITLKR